MRHPRLRVLCPRSKTRQMGLRRPRRPCQSHRPTLSLRCSRTTSRLRRTRTWKCWISLSSASLRRRKWHKTRARLLLVHLPAHGHPSSCSSDHLADLHLLADPLDRSRAIQARGASRPRSRRSRRRALPPTVHHSCQHNKLYPRHRYGRDAPKTRLPLSECSRRRL